MQITIASQRESWYTEQLKKAADKLSVDVNVQNITTETDLHSIGDVLYWRSSDIESIYPTIVQRSRFLQESQKRGIIVINKALIDNPYLTYKSYQQSTIETRLPSINTISTFVAPSIKALEKIIAKNSLKFPFIAKPDHGSQGANIILIKKSEDISSIKNISSYVFQNFVQNDGDFRIYVIGGVAVEIVKRTSRPGSFLNNTSQGGTVARIEDLDTREQLASLATHIAAAFDLSICGIDLIYNQQTKQYHFLEVNTVAQWQGLQNVTNINIAKHIITYLLSLKNPTKQLTTPKAVTNYYFQHTDFLSREDQFHFYSRLYLYTKDQKYYKKLKGLKGWYIWKTSALPNIINSLLENSLQKKVALVNRKDYRILAVEKYPLISAYNYILFKTLFTKTVYSFDHRQRIKGLLDDKIFHDYSKRLLEDKSSVFSLSTHAVNFLFLNKWLHEQPIDSHTLRYLLETAQTQSLPNNNATIQSQIYLLTHMIIGASSFYSQKIASNVTIYTEILKKIESIIINNYSSVSLDQKNEFLTCTKLLNHKTILKNTILNESHLSLSPHGTYIVDRLNSFKSSSNKDLSLSEHRNILYILANL